MDLGLVNKTAFVAASSQGLGKSVALELAKEGANVVICGRNIKTLEKTKNEIQQIANTTVLAIEGDLSDAEDRDHIIAKTLEVYSAIDILITNTGGPSTGKFEELTQKQWDKAYEQLLCSVTGLIRGFLPGMKTKSSARIITITSQAVKQPVDNLILSNSIRASVVGLMKTLANELGQYNITVNNVMPGFTQTRRLTKLIEQDPSFAKVADTIPLGRFARPQEFAAAVTFLASEQASYITGVSLAIDGGWIKNLL